MTQKNQQPATAEETIEVVKVAKAPKLSPRAGGKIGYEIGRTADEVYIRLTENQTGGKFSKEWLPLRALRWRIPQDGSPFHASALTEAFLRRSNNNHSFLTAVLRAEGILEPSGDKPGQSILAADLDQWAEMVRALDPVRAEPFKMPAPKQRDSDAGAGEGTTDDGDGGAPDRTEAPPETEGGDVPPDPEGKRKGKKKGKGRKPEPEADTEPAQDGPAGDAEAAEEPATDGE